MLRRSLLSTLLVALVACARPAPAPTVPDGYVTKAELKGVHKRLDSLERSLAVLLEIKAALDDIRAATRETAALLSEREEPPAPPPRRPSRPDPRAVFRVPVDGSPFVGPADAKVTIVKAFEFACRFCDRVRPTLSELRQRYGSDVRIVYKHFIVYGDTSRVPAYAACAAAMQGKFEPMYEAIFEQGFNQGRDLSRKKMLAIARSLRLKMKKFKTDMDSPACSNRVENDQALMKRVGVRGTPSFYINGRFLSGAQPVETFAALVDEELAKANKAIAAGAPPSELYDMIISTGSRSF